MSFALLAVIIGYTCGHVYILFRIRKWFIACSKRFRSKGFLIFDMTIVILMWSTTFVAFFLPISPFQRFLQRLSNYWTGIAMYALMVIVFFDVLRLILKHIRKVPRPFFSQKKTVYTLGIIVSAAVVVVSVYGVLHAHRIKVRSYEITVDKPAAVGELNVVLVADLHLGYNIGYDMMEQMVEKINAQKPDVVFFAGDIFDNVYDGIDKPEEIIELFKKIETKYGIYACYGNHDVSERLFGGFSIQSKSENYRDERMDEFLEKAGIIVLNDETTMIEDSIYIVGRMDYEKTCTPGNKRASVTQLMDGLDKSKPIIVLEHEPRFLGEVAAAGTDVHLCGHTHDGQFFPMNIGVWFIWENPCGYMKKGNMRSIVTSGVGVYGPFMRVGTDSEICNIKIKFSK